MTTMEIVGAPVGWWKGRRGEWYVAIQAALFLLVAFGPATAPWLPAWPAGAVGLSRWLGVVLLVGGIGWIIAGGVQLAYGRSLSALPCAKASAKLIDTGAFAWVRHPMYCGGIWVAFGCGLWSQGFLTIGYAVVLTAFFELKASREEQSLRGRFPEYRAYQQRVRKLTPLPRRWFRQTRFQNGVSTTPVES
jgi:protein-S-isoprenylcysteine O-methyltransferase Ste14